MKTNWPALRHGYLILASIAVASSPVLAQTQAPAGATGTAAVISSIAITQAPQRSAVRVEGEGRLDVHAGRMQNPDRLVLDFAGARLAVQKTVIPGISAPVRGVRIGQYRPDVARVVVDLTTASPYRVSREGAAVVIYFENPSTTPVEPVSSMTTLTSRQNEKERPEFHDSAASPRRVAGRSSKDFKISAPRFALPGELTQPSLTLASFSEKREPARPDSTTLVLDPAVKGSLTIVLDEVPWDQALDIVMQNNSLDKQLNGNVLRIATRATLKNEAETLRDLEKAQAEAIAPVTVTRVLSYAKASAMAPTLKKFLSSRGDVLYDDRSNQLIIRDIPSVIPILDNLIRQLDRKSQQVEIEARVVSASRSFARDIGTQLAFSGSGLGGRNLIGGDSGVGQSTFGTTNPVPPIAIVNSTPPVMPFVTNLGAVAPTSGLLLAHRSPTKQREGDGQAGY